MITMLWKDLLTDIGAYSKALEKVREGVSLCFTSGYGDVLKVPFPRSAVLYLRSYKNTPDRFKVQIEIPEPGKNGEYQIPVLKVKNYTLEEIFDRKLLFLIPFYIFSHESKFEEYNREKEKLAIF